MPPYGPTDEKFSKTRCPVCGHRGLYCLCFPLQTSLCPFTRWSFIVVCCQRKGSSCKVTAQRLSHFKSRKDALQAAGNCFNTLQASVMLAPLLRAAVAAGKLRRGVRQPPVSVEELSMLCVAKVPSEPVAVSPADRPGKRRRTTKTRIFVAEETL